MSEVKLSKTQQDLYDAMKAGVVVHYSPYMGRFNPTAYYYRGDNGNRCTTPAIALFNKGLVERCNHRGSGSHDLRIKGAAK